MNFTLLFYLAQVSQRYLPHLSILVGHSQQRSIGNKNENLQGILDRRLFQEDREAVLTLLLPALESPAPLLLARARSCGPFVPLPGSCWL